MIGCKRSSKLRLEHCNLFRLHLVAKSSLLFCQMRSSFVNGGSLHTQRTNLSLRAIEVKTLAARLLSVRKRLYNLFSTKLQTPGSWEHLKRTSGLYTSAQDPRRLTLTDRTLLLTPQEVEALRTRKSIALLPGGCVSLGCLGSANIELFAEAVDAVRREVQQEQVSLREQEELHKATAVKEQITFSKEQGTFPNGSTDRDDTEAFIDPALLHDLQDGPAPPAPVLTAEEQELQVEAERRALEEEVHKAAEKAEMDRRVADIIATIV